MYRILFVCHGNICRSPMAEFIFLDMLKKRGITGVTAASAATSTEEIGNPVHYGTASILRRLGIDFSAKRARQMTRSDAEEYDLLVGMDGANIRSMTRIAGEKYSGKIRRLLDFTDRRAGSDIADPWYTGEFETHLPRRMRGLRGTYKLAQTGEKALRTLERMHPAVCFLYLLAVLGFTAFAREPVTVLISLGGSVLLAALSGRSEGGGLVRSGRCHRGAGELPVRPQWRDRAVFRRRPGVHAGGALLRGVRRGNAGGGLPVGSLRCAVRHKR